MPKFDTYAKIKKTYNVSPETLKNRTKRGNINYKCFQNENIALRH